MSGIGIVLIGGGITLLIVAVVYAALTAASRADDEMEDAAERWRLEDEEAKWREPRERAAIGIGVCDQCGRERKLAAGLCAECAGMVN